MGEAVSGYNKRTGIFQLTRTKALYWLRRKDVPVECLTIDKWDSMKFFECILKSSGLEVVEDHGSYLSIKALPGQIWEALSGERSDLEHENYYLR
jgi:hypothetical protein